jgi:RNA polymerase-binding transcription factor DksA
MDIKEFKIKLENEKKEVLDRIKKIGAGKNFGDDVDGFEEDADESEENSNDLGIRESFEERLEHIEEALRKIDRGEYGICESCGNPIEKEVLAIDPESEYCKSCKVTHKGI